MKSRKATCVDLDSVLALNDESVQFLSPLTMQRLQALHEEAEIHDVIESNGTVIAFLIALREGAKYDSVNYRWFAERYRRFLYVDRVVVSVSHQGIGAGRLLYQTVFAHAQATEVPVVACEFDINPPNPASESFHAKFGFTEVGRQVVAGGKKSVSLQVSRVRVA